MSKKPAVKKADLPEGAVILGEREAVDFEPRTGAERVQKLGPGTYAIWPANRNAKGVPDQGPLLGEDKATGRKWAYWTHSLPDKDGVFAPAVYNIHPEDLAARVDERAARYNAMPANLRDLIEAHKAAQR